MLLSNHFAKLEFEKDGEMPDSCVLAYRSLCESILEPIRAHLGLPLRILSGYRSPAANAAAGGVSDSQHVATATACAADWWVPTLDMRTAFDWIRLESGLAFDQLILEHGIHNLIIHTSWSTTPRRMALEGATANRTGYITWPVTPKETNES
jgi:zinc D-Ala-D-Ala carboxypeptidase